MALYKVTWTERQYVQVTVQADDADEAKEKALDGEYDDYEVEYTDLIDDSVVAIFVED